MALVFLFCFKIMNVFSSHGFYRTIAQLSSAGKYACEASNEVGTIVHSVNVTVLGKLKL